MAQPPLVHPSAASGPEDPRKDRLRTSSWRVSSRARFRAWRTFGSALWPGAKERVALVRRVATPLMIALVPIFWVIDATHRASLTTLGRDQGIFQYIAWATRGGAVDYRDVRDVNGPLVHLIHSVFLALGGEDEHRFHLLELGVTALSFAVVGACLPGLLAKRAPKVLERVAWALAAAVVLDAQYQLYLYWNQAQRESFCDWFLLPSIALQLAWPARTRRGAAIRVAAIGALSAITWLGKPSFVLFTVMQLGVLLVDREVLLTRKERVSRFALGGALGLAVPLLYLVVKGDAIAFAKITFLEVPRIYRFIWARSAREILGDDGPLSVATAGLACTALLSTLIAKRELPRRVLVLALAPIVSLTSAIAQHKGFGYHFHPLSATTQMGWLVVVLALSERFRNAPRRRPLGRYAALGVAAAFALETASSMKNSPQTRNVWILGGGETPQRRAEKEYFDTFKSHDFFPWELRQGAHYLAEQTAPDARVQVYGMDPYILFLAKRRSATPYIYAYDLNNDAALDGGWSNKPDEEQLWRIRMARDAHEKDMLEHLRRDPPEAFVFIDRAPLISFADAWEDFRHCCAESAMWVAARYHPARSFGEVHVWFRDDLPVPDVEGPRP